MEILFICSGNVGRSQMAEAFFKRMSRKHRASSAGIRGEKYEGRHLAEFAGDVVRCMAELGYDISENIAKQLTPEMVKKADRIYVITSDELPDYLKNSGKIFFWRVEDAKGMSFEFHVKIRNNIKKLVENLVKEIG